MCACCAHGANNNKLARAAAIISQTRQRAMRAARRALGQPACPSDSGLVSLRAISLLSLQIILLGRARARANRVNGPGGNRTRQSSRQPGQGGGGWWPIRHFCRIDSGRAPALGPMGARTQSDKDERTRAPAS